ncbi:hypothetical protein U2F10_24055 [Leptothoe sp. EHU-05/26/07-4]
MKSTNPTPSSSPSPAPISALTLEPDPAWQEFSLECFKRSLPDWLQNMIDQDYFHIRTEIDHEARSFVFVGNKYFCAAISASIEAFGLAYPDWEISTSCIQGENQRSHDYSD